MQSDIKMDEKLIEKYKEYANSVEAYAVLFVKKYLRASKGKWVDILNFDVGYHNNVNHLEFEFVKCELFDRKIKPQYPPKNFFDKEYDYIIACRAITWEVAHNDIDNQRRAGIKGLKFQLNGVRNRYKNDNYTGYFINNTPKEIRDLLKNPNDRTDPLWEKALRFKSLEEPYIYKYVLKCVKRI